MKKENEEKSQENSHIAEAYEHVKYFEKQRGKTNQIAKDSYKPGSPKQPCKGNGSIYGEKLSFKGRLPSSKWDDSVVNCQVEDPAKNLNDEANACDRSNAEDRPFSFKNISSKNRPKNDERDTINDVLNSPNWSQKSVFKGLENNDKFEKLIKEHKELHDEYKPSKSLNLFGGNLNAAHEMTSPKTPLSPKSPRKIYTVTKHFIEDGPNWSMLGIIDENSNKIDHNFMFLDKTSNRYGDKNASMMFDHHSNTFLGLHGTPKKFEVSQNNIFEPSAGHSISMLFPRNESNKFERSLFRPVVTNESNKLKTPEKTKDNDIGYGVPPAVQPFIHKPEIIIEKPSFMQPPIIFPIIGNKINQEIPDGSQLKDDNFNNDDQDWSLPHPTDLFGIKDISMLDKTGGNKLDALKIGKKNKHKKSKKLKRKKQKYDVRIFIYLLKI